MKKTENQTFENQTFENQIDDKIDFGRLIRNILMQSKLVLSITFIFLAISLTYFLFATKEYKISSLLQVESFDLNSLDPTDTMQMISPMNNSGGDLDNLVTLYESRTNMIELINQLQLNIEIKDLNKDEFVDFNINSSLIEESVSKIFNKFLSMKTFYISYHEDYLKLYSNKKEFVANINFGEDNYIFENLIINVEKAYLKNDRMIKVTYQNPDIIYEDLIEDLDVSTLSSRKAFSNDEGLIQISYETDDISLGKKIINVANDLLIQQRLSYESEKSRAAINFIDENIALLEQVVTINQERVKNFLELNELVDIDLETKAVIEKVQLIDKSLSEIDIELSVGMQNYKPDNPLYKQLINQKKVIEEEKNLILSQIKKMPKEQQEYIDLFSDLETSRISLEELETRRLGFSIMEASTIGDIRVVDEAYMENLVSPQFLSVILVTIIAFLLSCIVAIIRGSNFLPISNPAEIFDNNLPQPMIGVIPFITKIENNQDDLKLVSSLESIIVNIKSLQNNDVSKNVIVLTSPTPSNGKSTISVAMAHSLSSIGKKVLVIDADFKRGTIGRNFLKKKSVNENEFLKINEENISSFKTSEGFYLIPRVRKLVNSFQFVTSKGFTNQLESFKKMFDYIIIDSAPILSVADTSVMINKSDFNFVILRHELSKISEVKQANNIFNQLNSSIDGYIYNAYAKPEGYYGYYGLYGNYAYQYYSEKYLYESYEYEKST
ncbi:AAA family ATPase [Candidatus Marinimicrobia bacterium]|nr:AAA family ATPase [Candidatus Neomarinimicrobiota bacterium]MDA9735723.1 AAA family ATPase [Candidatus Neomarinimicrobiota bacterium]